MGNGFVQKGDSNLQEGIRSRRKLWVSGADRYPTGIILTNRNPGLRWQAYDFPDRCLAASLTGRIVRRPPVERAFRGKYVHLSFTERKPHIPNDDENSDRVYSQCIDIM